MPPQLAPRIASDAVILAHPCLTARELWALAEALDGSWRREGRALVLYLRRSTTTTPQSSEPPEAA